MQSATGRDGVIADPSRPSLIQLTIPRIQTQGNPLRGRRLSCSRNNRSGDEQGYKHLRGETALGDRTFYEVQQPFGCFKQKVEGNTEMRWFFYQAIFKKGLNFFARRLISLFRHAMLKQICLLPLLGGL
jgi:hypothetical protein